MYTPRRSAVWLRSLGGATAGPCGISTEFCGAIGILSFVSVIR